MISNQPLNYAAGQARFERATPISWLMLALAITSVALVGWYVPHDRPEAEELMRSLHLALPGLTMAMFSIPDAAFYVAAVVGIVGTACIQWWGRGSINSAGSHMLMILLASLVFVLYRQSLYEPLTSLMMGISTPSRPH